jgi:hypothetical protein
VIHQETVLLGIEYALLSSWPTIGTRLFTLLIAKMDSSAEFTLSVLPPGRRRLSPPRGAGWEPVNTLPVWYLQS